MRIRGHRIIVFGDSLSHHGAMTDGEIWDVNQGSSRASSAPGDLLASMLLEAGANAVRVNANVGRSAKNFWTAPNARQRNAAPILLASDSAFRPSLVLVMLGTNDADAGGMGLEAITRIRDAYLGMGAEVVAIGPPIFESAIRNAAATRVYATLEQAFPRAVIDARGLSRTTGRAGDGVHFTGAGARPFAEELARAVQAAGSGAELAIFLAVAVAAIAIAATAAR